MIAVYVLRSGGLLVLNEGDSGAHRLIVSEPVVADGCHFEDAIRAFENAAAALREAAKVVASGVE